MVKTFTQSEQVLSYLQQQYGSADFSQWQVIRGAFYSFITYPEAGASELTFFGNALGSSGVTLHDLHAADLSALDPTRRTAVVCQSSQRSGIGASILAARGFADVHPVIGGGMGSPDRKSTRLNSSH